MVEKPTVEEAPSIITIFDRYVITPAIFQILEQIEPGKGGEIQLTDALKILSQKEAMYAYAFEGYDVDDKRGFLKATVEFALQSEEQREEFLDYLVKKIEQ